MKGNHEVIEGLPRGDSLKKIRQLDKLVDELAKGRPIERILLMNGLKKDEYDDHGQSAGPDHIQNIVINRKKE